MTRGTHQCESSLPKRITNLLFAGTVLAGSFFSIPAAAVARTDTQSLNDNAFLAPNSTSEYAYHGAKGGNRNHKTSSDDSSNLTEKNNGNSSQDSFQSNNGDTALQDYLSGLICTGCGLHCPLTALQCARGNAYLEQAKSDFAAQQEQGSSGRTTNSPDAQSGAESDLLAHVMEYAPFGGLMVGGVYYSIEVLKKKKSTSTSKDALWR